MLIGDKTIEKLRLLITEEIEYRSGPKLVEFFNMFGFNEQYGQGFPSRWYYVQEKLKEINGTPLIDECIKEVFSPINFIENPKLLETKLNEFNQYLIFDGWKTVIKGKEVHFENVSEEAWDIFKQGEILTEKEFLKLNLTYDIDSLSIDHNMKPIITERIIEIDKCIANDIPLAAIFLAGSTLEGILLNFALKYPQNYNSAQAAPTINKKVKKLNDWTLKDLIDVSTEIGFLKKDIQNYSHSLRDFRNYIHPYQQLTNSFSPSIDTAMISCQVLKAALSQLSTIK